MFGENVSDNYTFAVLGRERERKRGFHDAAATAAVAAAAAAALFSDFLYSARILLFCLRVYIEKIDTSQSRKIAF